MMEKLAAPLAPPRAWFDDAPEWLDATWESGVVQIGDDGRVAALVAPYGECILDGSRNCWTPPKSPTGYEFAHVGAARCDDGSMVRIANVGGGTPHFDPSRGSAMSPAVEHYANTATRMMYGRFHDRPDLGGIVFFGSLWPDLSDLDVMSCRLSALSGDWRWVESLGEYDLAGAQMVNVPGFRPNRQRRSWQLPKLAAMQFAVVACMTGESPMDMDEHGEVLRGSWTLPQSEPMAPMSVVRRLHALEMIVASLLEAMMDDDDYFDAEVGGYGYDDDKVPSLPYRPPMIAGCGCEMCGDDDYDSYDDDEHAMTLPEVMDRLYLIEHAVAELLESAMEDADYGEYDEDDEPSCPMCREAIHEARVAATRGGSKAKNAAKGKAMGAEKLREYWLNGKGAAKIRWGTDGDWTRCRRHLSKYMGPRAAGYCQLLHGRKLGKWAGKGQHKRPSNPAIKAQAIAKQMSR